MKKQFIILAFVGFSLAACSNSADKEAEKAEVAEMEAVEEELDKTIENLEAEEEDMEHDVDSLLEGI